MVFSGIVEEVGTVVSLDSAADVELWDGSRGAGAVLVVAGAAVLQGAYEGCSIAVNGTCLTVTAFTATQFTVGLAPETLRRTNLGRLLPGAAVNLERSLAADGRNSGHYVQGHVDGTGRLVERWRDGESLWLRVALEPALLRYVVPKGYVALDGVSLTVCEVDAAGGTFTIMLIAHTQRHVTLPRRELGDAINVEVDVMGKYAEQGVAGVAARIAALEATVARLEAALDVRLAALEAGAARGAAAPQGAA